MDTTISGRVSPRFCLFFLSRTLKTCARKYAVTLPASTAPSLAGQSSSARRAPGALPLPARGLRSAPPGSSRRAQAAAAGTLPSAVSGVGRGGRRRCCRRGCRCLTRGRMRGRAPGAPKPAESRRAASGTAREWRGARRPPQVRKAGAPAGGRRPASGPRTLAPGSAALCCALPGGAAPPGQPVRARSPSALLLVPRCPGP